MPTNDPGLKFEERAGISSIVRGVALNTFGIIQTAKRGPVHKAGLCTSWEEYARKFGGLKDDDIGGLSAYGFFAEGGRFLLVSRLIGTDARHSSRVVLDAAGISTALALTRWQTGQQDLSVSFRKASTSLSTIFPTRTNPVSTDVVNATKKYVRSTGSWVTDGWAVGQQVLVTGFVDAVSNGVKTITAISTTTIANDTITVSETVGANETLATSLGFFEPVRFTVADATAFEAGDVVCFDYATAPGAYVEVLSVDAANNYIYTTKRAAAVYSTSIASGTAIYTSSRHRASTTTTSVLSTGSAVVPVTSANNIKKGTVLLFLPVTVTEGAAFSRTVTSVSGLNVTLDSAPATAFASGAKVVSCEFHCDVKDAGNLVEQWKWLTMSPTHDADYLQDRLGPGVSFAYGSTALTTTAEDLTDDTVAFELNVTSAAAISSGDWIRITASASDPASAGATVQVKGKSSNTLSLDLLGNISATISSGASVWTATPTIADSDLNKSDFIGFDQLSYNDATASPSSAHLRSPYPYLDLALTGGVHGTDPATVATIKGSNVAGAKTGVYALAEADEFTNMVAFSVPGLLDTDAAGSANRQALVTALDAWAADEGQGVLFVDSVPSTVTKPLDAKSYRLNKLGIQSSYVATYFPQIKVYDPRDSSRVLSVAPEGWQMGLMARRAAAGINRAPANIPFITAFDAAVKVNPTEHEVLNDAGVNVILKKKGRGLRPMGARTLLNQDGTMRHIVGTRMWLIFFRRSVEASMQDRLFDPANSALFDNLVQPLQSFLVNQYQAGVFGPSDMGSAFYVKCDETTTTTSELSAGSVNVHIGVAMAPQAEQIKFIVYGYEGTVSGVREVI